MFVIGWIATAVAGEPPWVTRFRAALRAADLSQKAAALTMGITEAQLTRALKSEPGANIALRRMEGLGPRFHQEYASLLVGDFGLPDRFLHGARAALLVVLGGGRAMTRMAKMVLREDRDRATA